MPLLGKGPADIGGCVPSQPILCKSHGGAVIIQRLSGPNREDYARLVDQVARLGVFDFRGDATDREGDSCACTD